MSFEEHNRRLPEVADVLARADTSGRAERFDAIERRLGVKLCISDAAQLNGALGAALFAMEL